MSAGAVAVTATYTDVPQEYWAGDISQDLLVSGPDLDIVLAQWGNTGFQS